MNKTDVALSGYLRDVAHIALLTPEEEIELGGLVAKTLEQVSELIGVTRERVSQLEGVALAKLRRAFNKHLGPIEDEFRLYPATA